MATIFAGGIALAYALYAYGNNMPSYGTLEQKRNQQRPGNVPGYNPYILNQFQTMADVIYSAGLKENDIYSKPDRVTDGIYGITEHHIQMNRGDPHTIVNSRVNLNI